ncbi:MAG TPA: hypothetical protein PLL71_17200, partial [Agriterribacter sp.]|nr:hypothetical protein [Agriterribacter sp.]
MNGFPVMANNGNGNHSFTRQSGEQHTVWAAIGNNTIGSNQSVCAQTAPAALTGSTPTGGNGSFTFQWQSSTTSATTGFSNI